MRLLGVRWSGWLGRGPKSYIQCERAASPLEEYTSGCAPLTEPSNKIPRQSFKPYCHPMSGFASCLVALPFAYYNSASAAITSIELLLYASTGCKSVPFAASSEVHSSSFIHCASLGFTGISKAGKLRWLKACVLFCWWLPSCLWKVTNPVAVLYLSVSIAKTDHIVDLFVASQYRKMIHLNIYHFFFCFK